MSLSTSQLELRSGDPHDACYLADARRRDGDIKGAISALKRATKRWPDFGPAWSDLARLLIKAKDPKRGAQAAKMATKLIPESPVAWGHLGMAAAAIGNHRRALNAWEEALELEHPQREEIQEHIDKLLAKLRGRDGEWRGFERKDGSEVWSIRIDDDVSLVRYGKAGEKAKKERREFKNNAAARRHAERLIADKLREGFRRAKSRKGADESDEPKAKKAKSKPKTKAKSEPKTKAKKKSEPRTKAKSEKPSGRIGKAPKKRTGRFGKSSARLEKANKREPKTKTVGKGKDAPKKTFKAPAKKTSRLGGKKDVGKKDAPKKDGPKKLGKATGRIGLAKGKDKPIGKAKDKKPKGNARLRGKAPAARKRRFGR